MPITLVNIPKNTELCILELGMYAYGEINELAKIANLILQLLQISEMLI